MISKVSKILIWILLILAETVLIDTIKTYPQVEYPDAVRSCENRYIVMGDTYPGEFVEPEKHWIEIVRCGYPEETCKFFIDPECFKARIYNAFLTLNRAMRRLTAVLYSSFYDVNM